MATAARNRRKCSIARLGSSEPGERDEAGHPLRIGVVGAARCRSSAPRSGRRPPRRRPRAPAGRGWRAAPSTSRAGRARWPSATSRAGVLRLLPAALFHPVEVALVGEAGVALQRRRHGVDQVLHAPRCRAGRRCAPGRAAASPRRPAAASPRPRRVCRARAACRAARGGRAPPPCASAPARPSLGAGHRVLAPGAGDLGLAPRPRGRSPPAPRRGAATRCRSAAARRRRRRRPAPAACPRASAARRRGAASAARASRDGAAMKATYSSQFPRRRAAGSR